MIASAVTIAQNITLTIQPGVVVKLNPGSSFNVDGTLRSEGTAEKPVVITSLKDDSVGGDTNHDGTATTPAQGDWNSLLVGSSGTLTLSHTHVRYGGRYGANVYGLVELNGNGQATINNSVLTESYGYGIRMQPNGNSLVATLTLTDSTIESNRFDGVYAYANNGATNQVAITNATVRNNGQNGLQLSSVAHATITGSTFSGNTSQGISISTANGVNLSGNTFTNNGTANSSPAVQLGFYNGTFASLSANSGSGNGINAIMLSGSLAQDTTLPLNPGFPYLINNSLSVNQGVVLTFPTDLVVKLNPGSSINVNGTLRSEGTAEHPVVITSLKDDSVGGDTNHDGTATTPAQGDWNSLLVGSSGTLTLSHTHVRYGGRYGANVYGLVELNGNGQATINNSVLTESYGYGIRMQPNGNSLVATLTLTDSTIESNRFDGVYAYANNGATNQVAITNATVHNNGQSGLQLNSVANGVIKNSAIYGNTNAGLRNGTVAQVIDARNNWWGDPSGPNHPEQNPNGQGQSVSDGILFNPWLVVPPFGDNPSKDTVLTIGESKAFSMQPPLYAVFAVDTEPAKNLLITVDIGEGQLPVNAGIIRVLASRGRIATSSTFDTVAEVDAGKRHVELPIPNTLGGKYYIVVGLPFTVQGEVKATIQAQYVDLHITDVNPKEAGNVGDVTFTLDGTGFTNNMVATLISPSGQRIKSKEVIPATGGQIFVTFDLRGIELGSYSLELGDALTNALTVQSSVITIKQGETGRLKLHIEGPTSVRPGRVYSYKLVYENVGNADMPAPFVSVYTRESGVLLSSNGYTSKKKLIWLVSDRNSRGDLLPAGSTGFVDFYVSYQNSAKLIAEIVPESKEMFDWQAVEVGFTKINISKEMWINLKNLFGTSYLQVLTHLRLLNQHRQGAIALDALIELAIWTTANQTYEIQAARVNDHITGVDIYDHYTALNDVKLYALNRGSGALKLMSSQPTSDFIPSSKTIFITHGWRDGYNGDANSHGKEYEEMAIQLGHNYPTYNIVLVTWEVGAASPPRCLVKYIYPNPEFPDPMTAIPITRYDWPDCAQIVSTRIPTVAEIVYQALVSRGYNQWSDTIYIGHSFGNAVNAYISRKAAESSPYMKGTALLLNPANDAGFWFQKDETNRDYKEAFRKSTAIYTYSVADSKYLLRADKLVEYVNPDCNGDKCNIGGESHGSAKRLITCWLMDANFEADCGNIAKGKQELAKAFIENNWDFLQVSEGSFSYEVEPTGKLTKVEEKCVFFYSPVCIPVRTEIVYATSIPLTELSCTAVRSSDPNDKIGPTGHGEQKIVSSDSTLNYTINFENMPTATAPVQELHITDQLDPNLDWSTFQFTAISYGDRVLSINSGPGILEYAAQDYPPTAVITGTTEGEMRIDIEAKLNFQTGVVEWYLKAIDDATNDFPLDALAGFLPPEDGSGRGQGYVMFAVKPKADVPLGTTVKNKATIVFDTNAPITTNEVANLVGEAVDLVVLASGPATATVNSEIDHVFTVINDGPQNATNVTLNYTLPVGSEFVAVTSGQGACNGSVPIVCNLGTINNGTRTTVAVRIRPTISGTLESGAAVATGVIEINEVDNSAKVRTASIAQPPVEQPQYTLTTNTVGNGSVSVNPSGPYPSGTQVQLTATPAAGWRFVRWESTVALGDQATQSIITVTVTGDATYTAHFELDTSPPPTNSIYLPLVTR